MSWMDNDCFWRIMPAGCYQKIWAFRYYPGLPSMTSSTEQLKFVLGDKSWVYGSCCQLLQPTHEICSSSHGWPPPTPGHSTLSLKLWIFKKILRVTVVQRCEVVFLLQVGTIFSHFHSILAVLLARNALACRCSIWWPTTPSGLPGVPVN